MWSKTGERIMWSKTGERTMWSKTGERIMWSKTGEQERTKDLMPMSSLNEALDRMAMADSMC